MHKLLFLSFSSLVSCGLILGCGVSKEDGNVGGQNASDSGPDRGDEFADAAPKEACDKMDILFVIDNSGSMEAEQENLIANFSGFAELVDNYITSSDTPIDYRIAVTTAGRDVSYTLSGIPFTFNESGDNGAFRRDCGNDKTWIERADGDVASTFSCRANVGTNGPGAEMPLLGMEWSLSRRMDDGTNAGFLREDALLALVMITDQDDCSRDDDNFEINSSAPSCFNPNDSNIKPISHYLDFLDTLKGDRKKWASAVIAGPGPASCNSNFGTAAGATRMVDFVSQAGDNSVLSSICSGDLTNALEEALDTFESACDDFPIID
jgi:hypothetical protein